MNEDEENIRKEVRKEFLMLQSQTRVIGGNQTGYVADRFLDMYRIAKDRLDDGSSILKIIYADNPEAPPLLKNVMTDYVSKKITKDDASKKLDTLQKISREELEKMNIRPSEESPVAITISRRDSETELKADILADSMVEGKIDTKKLFLNTAELFMYKEWAELSETKKKKRLRKKPSADELLEAHKNAFERCYESNKQNFSPVFGGDEGFNKWLSKFFERLESNKKEYYKGALPVYQAVAKKVEER